MGSKKLSDHLATLRRRMLLIAGAAGTVWGLSAVVLALVTWAWLDLLWELSPNLRITAWWCALGLGAMVVFAAVLAARRRSQQRALARRLDQLSGSGGEILSGLELAGGQIQASPMSKGLALLAVENAARLATKMSGREVVPNQPLKVSLGAFTGLAAVIFLPALMLPDLAGTQWRRFFDPFGNTPPFSRIKFDVKPGDGRVLYGSGMEVIAATSGPPVEHVDLVLRTNAGGEETLPMFPEGSEKWRATLADLREPTAYYVRSGSARSRVFQIEIITVPRIENVRFVVTMPPYANQSPYSGPLPNDGLAGLAGTEVRVTALSNRSLSGGSLKLVAGGKSSELAMQPVGSNAQEVAAAFEIRSSGKFELTVTDRDGQRSPESFAGSIRLLEDQRPFVRILEPAGMSLATPDVAVPISMSAEDDYGISKLQLFRSLNGSRPMPMDLPLPAKSSRRLDQSVELPLAAYGLVPGDVIKLFARVEDNDPAGAKGSESSVVTLQIVSQEDFERMLQTRYNLEMLLSKYHEAERRMEALREKKAGLQKKLKEEKGEQLSKETQAELDKLQEQIEQEAKQLRESAARPLPYDVDKNLSKHLERLAASLEKSAQRLKKLKGSNAPGAAKALDELFAELEKADLDFEQEAVQPLEHLELVFPLIADQARFVELYQRQRDLAERLAALRGTDGEDSPAAKARMRDLEAEQRRLRESLDELLNDIDEHLARLPEEEAFADLRRTAQKFVDALRASPAAATMAEAEAALAEFSGTKSHDQAKKAADILESFLSKCQGMGESGSICLKFSPGLSAGMGNSIDQLLADMGLSSGQGMQGQGRGGYSARRGSSDSVGLYGKHAGLDQQFGGNRRGTGQGRGGSGNAAGAGSPSAALGPAARLEAAGSSAGEVPTQYRNRVSEYFQRLVEELNEP